MGGKTVFLDRDGVINRRVVGGYVTKIEELHLLPGVKEAVSLLIKQGFRLAVVTNQRGIALRLYTPIILGQIHRFLAETLLGNDWESLEFYYCPHDRDEGCSCRKPEPGLLQQAHTKKNVDWEHSFLIGDADSDLLAGKAMGCQVLKIGKRETVSADGYFPSLLDAARYILERA